MHLIADIVTYFAPDPLHVPHSWAVTMIVATSRPTTIITSAFAANTASPSREVVTERDLQQS
jgi:hypothetical protein